MPFPLAASIHMEKHRQTKRYSPLSLVVLFLLAVLSSSAYAANRFKYLDERAPLPEEKFIYVIYDLQTKKIHLGYSPDQPPATGPGPIDGGVRNGGHVALAMIVANVQSEQELNRINPYDNGHFVGGGMVIGNDGHMYLHPFMSLKAAGSSGIMAYINPRLNVPGESRSSIIPEIYGKTFVQAIGKRVGKPIKVDNDLFNSTRFRFNFKKHGDNAEKNRRAALSMSFWLNRVVADYNSESYGLPVPTKEIARVALDSDLRAIQYDKDLIFDTDEGKVALDEALDRTAPNPALAIYLVREDIYRPALSAALIRVLKSESGKNFWSFSLTSEDRAKVLKLMIDSPVKDKEEFFDFLVDRELLNSDKIPEALTKTFVMERLKSTPGNSLMESIVSDKWIWADDSFRRRANTLILYLVSNAIETTGLRETVINMLSRQKNMLILADDVANMARLFLHAEPTQREAFFKALLNGNMNEIFKGYAQVPEARDQLIELFRVALAEQPKKSVFFLLHFYKKDKGVDYSALDSFFASERFRIIELFGNHFDSLSDYFYSSDGPLKDFDKIPSVITEHPSYQQLVRSVKLRMRSVQRLQNIKSKARKCALVFEPATPK